MPQGTYQTAVPAATPAALQLLLWAPRRAARPGAAFLCALSATIASPTANKGLWLPAWLQVARTSAPPAGCMRAHAAPASVHQQALQEGQGA
jgi:hypothetical protein